MHYAIIFLVHEFKRYRANKCQTRSDSDPMPTASTRKQRSHADSDPTPAATTRIQRTLTDSDPSATATPRKDRSLADSNPTPTATTRRDLPFFHAFNKVLPLRSFHSLVTTPWPEHDLKQTPLQSITSTHNSSSEKSVRRSYHFLFC